MYVTDTGVLQAHGGPGNGQSFSADLKLPATIYEFDVVDGGKRLANRRMFAFCDSGIPDGIKCDVDGNVWSGCGDGVHVWAPDGTLLGKVYVGGVIANFNFTKEGIWMMAEEKLFFAEVGVKGCLVAVECE